MAPTTDELDKRLKQLEEKRIPLIVQFLVPTGTVIPFAGSTAPSGWLLCDGSAIGRVEYAALFEVIKETYGAGDSSTTFNLPDLGGRVVIGTGSSPQLTVRKIGEMIGTENHTLTTSEIPQHNHGGSTSAADGTHTHAGTIQKAGKHNHGGSTDREVAHKHSGVTGGTNLFAPIGTRSGTGLIEGSASVPYGPRAVYPLSSTVAHQHNFETSEAGNHDHSISTTESEEHEHGLTISDGGGHKHDFLSDGGDGEGKPHNNMQPSLVLNYIIKI